MKRIKDSTKWNEVVYQVNERTNESLKRKREKTKIINEKLGMHSRMMKDEKLEKSEGRMANNRPKEQTNVDGISW